MDNNINIYYWLRLSQQLILQTNQINNQSNKPSEG